jgi:hypothetical protein
VFNPYAWDRNAREGFGAMTGLPGEGIGTRDDMIDYGGLGLIQGGVAQMARPWFDWYEGRPPSFSAPIF